MPESTKKPGYQLVLDLCHEVLSAAFQAEMHGKRLCAAFREQHLWLLEAHLVARAHEEMPDRVDQAVCQSVMRAASKLALAWPASLIQFLAARYGSLLEMAVGDFLEGEGLRGAGWVLDYCSCCRTLRVYRDVGWSERLSNQFSTGDYANNLMRFD